MQATKTNYSTHSPGPVLGRERSLVAHWPAALGPGEPPRSAGRISVALGGDIVELRRYETLHRAPLLPTAAVVHLIVPLVGRVSATSGERGYVAAPGQALLLAQPERSACVWSAGAEALVFHLRRARIQAAANAVLETPSRLAASTFSLSCAGREPLGLAVSALRAALLARGAPGAADAAALDQAVVAGLVDALRRIEGQGEAFSVAASLKRAVDHVRAHPGRPCSADTLAAVAGVTVATLRRSFKACLGLSILSFVQQVRLDWVRARLRSATESRSIHQIAMDAGFGAAGALARAYQRRFSETPSQTRARAFATPQG